MDLKELRVPLILTITIMLLGTAYYAFVVVPNTPQMADASLYDGARFKTAFLPDGSLKVFILARNSKLMMADATEGSRLPESDAMVLGAVEAAMMREEKLFNSTNDTLKDFFGIDTAIGGILKLRGDLADDAHFLSDGQFAAIKGEEGRIAVKTAADGALKVFYRYEKGEALPVLRFAEGSLDTYSTQELDGITYVPVVIGAKEAKMMREERLFTKPGDRIQGLFGANVIIVGVLDETGTALDMMHLVPANSGYVDQA